MAPIKPKLRKTYKKLLKPWELTIGQDSVFFHTWISAMIFVGNRQVMKQQAKPTTGRRIITVNEVVVHNEPSKAAR